MLRKYEQLKRLQIESGELQNELETLKVEANRVRWQIELIKQDSTNDTPMQPLIERLQSARNEIEKLGKRGESLTESIQDLSVTLISYAIRETEALIDKSYEALNILKVEYDKAWRQLQNDEGNRLKQASVKTLRDRKIKLEDNIRESEHLVKMLQAGSHLSLDRFFKQQGQEVAA